MSFAAEPRSPRAPRLARWAALLLLASWEPSPASAQDGEGAPEGEGAADGGEPELPAAVEPPRVLDAPAPRYPDRAAAVADSAPTVVLEVTLDAEGRVVGAMVRASAGEAFDAEALRVVRTWRFAPARRGGEAIAARVRVAVPFRSPEAEAEAESEPESESEAESEAEAEAESESEADSESESEGPPRGATSGEDFGATAEVEAAALRVEERAASDFAVDRELLEAAPHAEGADMLRTAPGFYVARPAGDAVAHRIMVRGFDAEHGQDLDIRVAGVPVNQRSHIHGQGYADLGFVIPEVVHRLDVSEGVYDPRQGDFAVAGSVDFALGVEERGVRLATSYGSFHTFRQLALWAPEGAPTETFGAVQLRRTDGFGANRRGLSGSAIVQVAGERPRRGWRLRGLGVVHAARASLAGVVRSDDVQAGVVDLHGVYPFPTAQAQSAASLRALVGVFGERREASGANTEVGVYLGLAGFRAQQNFTGFIQESRTLEDVAGRGDLVEQRNRAATVGLLARHRSAPMTPWSWLEARFELGTESRVDSIAQSQSLLDASVRNQTWDQRVDADILGADIGLYGDLELAFASVVRWRAGARADLLLYEVDDRLGNFAPATRPDDAFIPGFRRSALGVAAGPRTSVEVRAHRGLKLLAAYGEGFRSPQARLLEDGEQAPFTKVRSADVGLRAGRGELFTVTLAGYWTRLSDDVAFDIEEASLRRTGATRRLGVALHLEARPLPFLVGSASVTYVDAELLEPPPATAEEPSPPFVQGQNLPFVPPLVVRVDAGVHGAIAVLGGDELRARFGVGYSYLSPRPLPFGASAAPVNLLDASASIAWRFVKVAITAFNLIDTDFAAFEYDYASDWSPGDVRSRVPARHLAAGAPRTILGTVELSW